MNSAERRSSSRSIKRKRFDDEIVDYALPSPISRMRQRTNSTANLSQSAGSNECNSTAPAGNVPSSRGCTPPPATANGTKMKSSPAAIPEVEKETPISTSASPKSANPPAVSTSPLPIQSAIKLETPQVGTPAVAIAREPQPTPIGLALTHSFVDRKLKNNPKKNRKVRGLNQMTTKDLGRWKPVDDLALILGVQQTNDLKMVHRGVKFSCKFTLNELQNRWYALLYEESVSRIAVAAMRNLHPELVENIQSKALYTAQEEDVLATIKSTESPSLDVLQELLRKNSSIFYSARTPKQLQTHWQLMKQYFLLPDQVLKLPGKDGTILSFSDNEDLMNDTELTEPKDEALDMELGLVDRRNKREIRQLENELGRWNVLVDSMTGLGFPEFDRQTLAVLRGRLVRYLMRSREISIGRSTKDSSVDVDLCLEGPAFKVSRKQGTIKMRSNADFFLTNEGKRPIYVDGMALLTGFKTRLSHNCALEIAGLRFTFLVNFDLVNAIQQESAKMNIPLT